MQQEQQAGTRQTSIANNPKLRAMARILAVKINSVLPFPLTAEQVEDWVTIIDELRNWVTPEHLDKVANRFVTGTLNWDRNLGIQNLFRGIAQTEKPGQEKTKTIRR